METELLVFIVTKLVLQN